MQHHFGTTEIFERPDLGGPDVETADVVPGSRSMNFYSVVSVGHGRTGDTKDSVYRTTDKRL